MNTSNGHPGRFGDLIRPPQRLGVHLIQASALLGVNPDMFGPFALWSEPFFISVDLSFNFA